MVIGGARTWMVLIAAAFAVVLSGCTAPKDVDVSPAPAPPSYQEVASRFNDRVEHMDRIWSRTVMVLEWVDSDGKRHREQGEGNLQLRRYAPEERASWGNELAAPVRVAMSIKKLGNTGYWLGCDRDQYWWVDAYEAKTAYVARHVNYGRSCCDDVGLPIHPIALIDLLAITRLNVDEGEVVAHPAKPVWIVDTSGAWTNRRLWIDPTTMEPTRVELVGHDETVLAWAELSEYVPLEVDGVAPTVWPRVPGVIRLKRPDGQVSTKISLYDPTDARRDRRKLSDAAFQLDRVARALRVDRIVQLDAACE
jgi:hypothetical protein